MLYRNLLISAGLVVGYLGAVGTLSAKPILEPKEGKWQISNTYAGATKPKGQRYIADTLTRPVPTNRWWSSLMWDFQGKQPFSERMYPHPLAIAAEADGLGVSYPTQATVANKGKHYEYLYYKGEGWDKRDLLISVNGLQAQETKINDFSDWTVSALWQQGNKQLITTTGHGIPYIFAQAKGGDARIVLNDYENNLNVWYQQGDKIGLTINGHHYGLFAPGDSQWQLQGKEAIVSLAGTHGYFSVAVLPKADESTLNQYAHYAFNVVKDTQVSWKYDEQEGKLKATYRFITEAIENRGADEHTIMALYPHQWKLSENDFLSGTYTSPRGIMKTLTGNEFTTTSSFHGVLPGLPLAKNIDKQRLSGYLQTAVTKIKQSGFRPDTYFGGKDMGKLAHLLPITEQLNNTALRNEMITMLKAQLEQWFDGHDNKTPLFHYHQDWHTLVGYPASFGSDKELNDHHFHWGYFIQVAAAIARYDQDWAKDQAWGGLIKMLIRDAANPDRKDPDFPFMRNFDPYAGHSWASGHGNFAHGNNQESSSEDMNFATGLILWGEATQNKTIRDLGIYIYTTEQEAIHQYWFDVDQENFPSKYEPDIAAIVWGAGSVYATWWTAEPESIHGINFLPFHGGSLYLGHYPEALARNYQTLLTFNGGEEGNGGSADDWEDIIWMAQAFRDANTFLAKFNAKADQYRVESGETKAHTYHWLAALNDLGQVDTNVIGNWPATAVFQRAGNRSYVAYNSTCKEKQVAFNDGITFSVKPQHMAVFQNSEIQQQTMMGLCGPGGDTPDDPSIPPNNIPYGIQLVSQSVAQFFVKKAKWVDVHYQINQQPQQNVRMQKNQQGQWILRINNLKPNDVVRYFFTIANPAAKDTPWQRITISRHTPDNNDGIIVID
ncbi:glycosyl hydrolase [Zooshikella sp. RANM57]|uniref:glycosyl hydrolase n=1 Tax=Zooshikella sp. RANM57 TaxID=3425863 RepID=UPI003D6ECF4C